MKELYLDSNAHVSLLDAAKSVYNNFSHLGHPSSLHMVGRKSALMYEQARAKIAELIGAKSANQIIFTSSCTQAAEWSVQMLSKYSNNNTMFVCSDIEHIAVRDAVENANFKRLSTLHINSDGKLIPKYTEDDVFQPWDINDADYLICIHSHNEFGTIQNFSNIKRKFLFQRFFCGRRYQDITAFSYVFTKFRGKIKLISIHIITG